LGGINTEPFLTQNGQKWNLKQVDQSWVCRTLDALATGGGEMPFLDAPDASEDVSPDYQWRNAETMEHMLSAACSSFDTWARRNNVPADAGPLAGSILAYRPPVAAGEARREVEVQRSGCVVLPPREDLRQRPLR
jgi:hypothetical protein